MRVEYFPVEVSSLQIGQLHWLKVQPVEALWSKLGSAYAACEVVGIRVSCIEVTLVGSVTCIPLHVIDSRVPLYRKVVS